METMYKVLVASGRIEELGVAVSSLLVEDVESFDYAPQEHIGPGFVGDFNGADERGEQGEVWHFVTERPEAIEAVLNTTEAVLIYKQTDC